MDDLPTRRDGTCSVGLGRLLTGEIALGTAINVLFNLLFAWLAFGGKVPAGRDAVMLDVLPATFIPALLMTFPVTVLIRARLRRGLTVTPDVRLPLAMPRRLMARAPVIALLALALVAAPVVLLLWLLWSGPWSWTALLSFKLAFSLFHSAAVTPIVVLTALREDR